MKVYQTNEIKQHCLLDYGRANALSERYSLRVVL